MTSPASTSEPSHGPGRGGRAGALALAVLAAAYVAGSVAAGFTIGRGWAEELETPTPADSSSALFDEATHPALTPVGAAARRGWAARLPLTFVSNQGQVDPRIRYYADGPGYAFSLTSDAIVVFSTGDAATNQSPALAGSRRLELRFVKANSAVVLEASEPSPGVFNYLIGRDPTRWHTNVPAYASVTYRDLWPGIDMVVRGAAGRLTYEFRIAPYADLDRIRLAYVGADPPAVDSTDGFTIQAPSGSLVDSPLVPYQVIDDARRSLTGRMVAPDGGAEGRTYGLRIDGAYDRHQPLVIGRELAYSTYLGGLSYDEGVDVAVDASGNVYVVGNSNFSGDFPTTRGAFDPTFNGVRDVFVTKLDPTGSSLVYSTYIGGSLNEVAEGMKLDAAGDVYVVGWTNSDDFPTTVGAFSPTNNGDYDGFIAKLNPHGTDLVYSTFIGGSGADRANDVAVDGRGRAHVVGIWASSDFPTTPGAFDSDCTGDGFVLALNATGSDVVYSTCLGSGYGDGPERVTMDGAGYAYVTGTTATPGFPTTPGALDSTRAKYDLFVTKLDPRGASLVYSTLLGGSRNELAAGIAVDSDGNAIVAGITDSRDFPTTPDAYDRTYNGDNDAFIVKLNRTGSRLLWSTFFGGTRNDSPFALAVDARGHLFLTGYTFSRDLPLTPGAPDSTIESIFDDAFVVEMDASGSRLLNATFLGGAETEFGLGVAVDSSGDAYVTGSTESSDFPTTSGAFDRSRNGTFDAFIAKLDFPPEPRCGSLVATRGGTDGDDVLNGTEGRDVIQGLGGNDLIRGLGGDDVICGGTGNDGILGGEGDDSLEGGSGDDVLEGGSGNDAISGGLGRDALLGGSGDDRLDGGTDPVSPNASREPADFCDGGSHVLGDTAVHCEVVVRVP